MDPKKNGLPAGPVKPKAEMRPSQKLVQHQLNRSLRTNHLGIDVRSDLINGSVDLYSRLKPRDPIDSMYISAIVGLHNSVMQGFGDAAEGGKRQDERAHQAIEGTRTLIDLIEAFETRRAVKLREDPDIRRNHLLSVLDRLGYKDGT